MSVDVRTVVAVIILAIAAFYVVGFALMMTFANDVWAIIVFRIIPGLAILAAVGWSVAWLL